MRIRFIGRGGTLEEGALPDVLAALSRDEVESFPALRPHQRQAWHCFLVQVGTLALRAADADDLPKDAESWRSLLLGLTPDFPNGDPWELVVEDRDLPALLQPPGMPGVGGKGTRLERSPDAIDMLLTGRNHDVKGDRVAAAQEDDWLFALVTLQTLEGQMGAGNPGISRMNGGYGARVQLGLRWLPYRWGTAFERDVRTLLERWASLAERSPVDGDVALTWLLPSDGQKSIGTKGLDPLYIDCCRRVRLLPGSDGTLCALVTGSKVPRVDAKAMNGVTGDPWAPTLADGSKSWGVTGEGFGYRRMATLLSAEDVDLPLLALPTERDFGRNVALYACAIARGQGKTEGLHERSIPMPTRAVRRFGRPEGRVDIAREAEARRDAAGGAQGILRHALFALFQGGPEGRPRLDDDATKAKVVAVLHDFDVEVDHVFFDANFWEVLDDAGERPTDPEARARRWRRVLRDIVRTVFARAAESAPRTRMRYHRALARSTSILEGRLARFLDPAGDDEKSPPAHAGATVSGH